MYDRDLVTLPNIEKVKVQGVCDLRGCCGDTRGENPGQINLHDTWGKCLFFIGFIPLI